MIKKCNYLPTKETLREWRVSSRRKRDVNALNLCQEPGITHTWHAHSQSILSSRKECSRILGCDPNGGAVTLNTTAWNPLHSVSHGQQGQTKVQVWLKVNKEWQLYVEVGISMPIWTSKSRSGWSQNSFGTSDDLLRL